MHTPHDKNDALRRIHTRPPARVPWWDRNVTVKGWFMACVGVMAANGVIDLVSLALR